jgi:hypothetical protein
MSWVWRRYSHDGGGGFAYTYILLGLPYKVCGERAAYKNTNMRTRARKIRIPANTQRPQRYHSEWQLP